MPRGLIDPKSKLGQCGLAERVTVTFRDCAPGFSFAGECIKLREVIRRPRLLFLLSAPIAVLSGPVLGGSPQGTPQRQTVAVILALESQQELHVPWHSELTLDAAIQSAAKKKRSSWKEAWRYRESFWTRNFRNPHSFLARLLAGEKATGYSYFQNSPDSSRPAALRPGDKIYVDLAPIF